MGLYSVYTTLFGSPPRHYHPQTPHCWRQEFKYVGGVHGYSLSSDFRPYNPAVWEPPIENLSPLLNPYHVPGIAGRLYDIRNRDIDKPGYDPRPRDYNLQNRRKALLWPEELPFFVGLYEKAVYAKANGIPYVPIEPKKAKRPHHRRCNVSDLSSFDLEDSEANSSTPKVPNDIPANPDLSPSRSSSLNTQSGSEKGSAVSWKIPRPPREYKEEFVDAEGKIHDINEFNSEYLIAMIDKYEQSRLRAKSNITAKKAVKQATKRVIDKVKVKSSKLKVVHKRV